ncbi:MAG: hypothetical protein LBH96_06090 [Candidatus Peribacteria bacterium]|jgi:peptidoglycan hydrolase-like amidase|nr:hypothetical protein [Candidatus Peribacteria bacterium]
MKIKEQQPQLLQAVVDIVRERYKGTLPNATNTSNKLTHKYTLADIKELINQEISVLLYELTTEYTTFDIKCEQLCTIQIDGESYQRPSFTVSFIADKLYIQKEQSSDTFAANEINITSQNELIEITNYNRTSYAGIPRNTFRGSLRFEISDYRTLKGETKHAPILINTLPFMDYMKGIVETNDTEHLEKNKVMAMISKNYALFYLGKRNLHPSIPVTANFSAIDSPDMFQKYVGAGAEKTLTKRYQALEATKNQIILYNATLPILPYFSCSAGFTLSAKEKYGRLDTPYLKSVYDFSACNDFSGHGVGLAGKGAEFFAQKGMNYQDILKYYYDGIEIVEI